MSFEKPCALALFAVALWPQAASAQVSDPVLASLIENALAKDPALAAARHSLAAAAARSAQSGLRTGPMLNVTYRNDGLSPSLGSRDMTMLALGASQELAFPGKQGLRRKVAEAEAGLVALDLERARLSLVADVKRAYYGLALARTLAALADEQRGVWEEVKETARVRYASAVGPQQDLLRAQVEGTRVQALHAQHHAEARARLLELNRLTRRPAGTPVDTATLPALTPESRSLDALLLWSEATSPELAAAAALVQRDELAVALARKERKPDLTVQGAYVNRGGLDPMWEAGVSVLLPSRERVRAGVSEAEARLLASRARLDDVRGRLRSAVEQRLTVLAAAEEIEKTYREGLIPQGRGAVESTLARLQAGQGPQLAVLESAVTLLEDRADQQRLLAAHATESSRLEEVSLESGAGLESLLTHGRASFSGGGMGVPSMPSVSETR